MAFFAANDVIVHGDAEIFRGFDDLFGHLDIGLRRRGVAGGVVVHQDDGGGRQLQRALDDLAHIDRRVVDGAFLLHFVGDDAVALVEKQNADLRQALEL